MRRTVTETSKGSLTEAVGAEQVKDDELANVAETVELIGVPKAQE